jgi:hypothetical protein
MRSPAFTLVVAAGFLSACASGANIASAAINSAVAVGVSAARRANGECYTPCVSGTACNRQTGLCDTLPCRGECSDNQECVVHAGGLERCEGKAINTPLRIETKAPAPKPSTSPSDAPTAEENNTSP